MANSEQLVEQKPLHGDWIYGLKVSTTDSERTLARRWYAMEFGTCERVRTQEHPDYPGVSVIDTFQANSRTINDQPSLEEAIELNARSIRFLLSVINKELVVVTSRFAYAEGGPVNVLPGHSTKPDLEIDLYDASGEVEYPLLTALHVGRVASLGGKPEYTLPQHAADDAFRHMVSRTPERR